MLIGGIVARPRPRPRSPAAASATSPRSGCAGSGSSSLAVIVRFGTECGARRRRRARRDAPAPAASRPRSGSCSSPSGSTARYPGLSLAFVGILSNAIVDRRQRRLHADLGAEPRRRRLPRRPTSTRRSTRSCRATLDADFLLHARAARRHHPDPAPVHPERRLDRRRVPDGRPRLLPVRDRRPHPEQDAGRRPPETLRGDSRRRRARADAAASRRPTSGGGSGRRRAGRRPRRARRSMLGGPVLGGRAAPACPRRARRLPHWRRPGRRRGGRRGAGELPLGPRRRRRRRRVRRHPYVRLALNGSFSALWAGQLISLFGDRLHQIALAVARPDVTTGSAARGRRSSSSRRRSRTCSSRPDRRHARRPLGPQGGHDRQRPPAGGDRPAHPDRRGRPTSSSSTRSSSLVTTISIFFRPARVAILPRIVREDDLLTANSAMWIGETIADVIGYPLAGLFVGVPRRGAAARVLDRRRDLPRVGALLIARSSSRRVRDGRGAEATQRADGSSAS